MAPLDRGVDVLITVWSFINHRSMRFWVFGKSTVRFVRPLHRSPRTSAFRQCEIVAHSEFKKQHLIDPEICIRCNTCEATCPVGAVTHDDINYVVDAEKCNYCMDCIAPCPTGSIGCLGHDDVEAVMKMVAGTARSMGVEVEQ